jgi:hypothetical protein
LVRAHFYGIPVRTNPLAQRTLILMVGFFGTSRWRPNQFTLDEVVYKIDAVLDQWYEPTATYFKVKTVEAMTYLLRYDEEADEWPLQSGSDGDELLARPSIELVTVDSAISKKAEQQIDSCEHCHSADAEIQ